jgi:hypothetical protein
VAEDGGGGEVVALDLAHQVLVDVRLPRHLRSSLVCLQERRGEIGEGIARGGSIEGVEFELWI